MRDLGWLVEKVWKCTILFSNVTEEIKKIKLFKDNFVEFSFEELKDELEEVPNI